MSELLIKLYKNRFLKKIMKYKKPLTPSEGALMVISDFLNWVNF